MLTDTNLKFSTYINQSIKIISRCESLDAEIKHVIEKCLICLKNGGTIFWAGNGGSAAESQHLSAELVGRFMQESIPFRSVALTTDTSAITAIGNDYGYEEVFSRQLTALARQGDIVVTFSTSGRSKNILRLFQTARKMGVYSVLFTGEARSASEYTCDIPICVPSNETWHIQEAHTVLGHFICASIEYSLSGS